MERSSLRFGWLFGRAVRLTVCFLVLLALLVLFLPTLLTRRLVYQPLLDAVDASGNQLQLESFTAGWFTPLRLEQLVVTDPEDRRMIEIAEVQTEVRLLDLITDPRTLGRVIIRDPVVDIRFLDATSNLAEFQQAIDDKVRKREEQRAPPAVDIDLDVRNLVIRAEDAASDSTLWQSSGTNFVASYDGTGDEPRLRLREAQLLDRAPLTRHLLDKGLQFALPSLHNSGEFEGEVSIYLDDCELPLKNPALGSMSGTITLHQVSAAAKSPLLLDVLQVAGGATGRSLPSSLVVADESEVAFRFSDGEVWHEGLRFGFPQWDARIQFATAGRVGLDRTLDLTIDVPIPIEPFARREAVAAVGVPLVSVPVTGTLDDPKLELADSKDQIMRIAADVLRRRRTGESGMDETTNEENATAELLEEGIRSAADVLEALRERRSQDAEAGETAERRGRGLLRRLLRGSESPTTNDAPPREAF